MPMPRGRMRSPQVKRPVKASSNTLRILAFATVGIVVVGAAYFTVLHTSKAHPRNKPLDVSAQGSSDEDMQQSFTQKQPSTEEDTNSGAAVMGGEIHQVRRVVVVGGGLAGCTAALSAARHLQAAAPVAQTYANRDWEVVVVEKMPKLGGNSMKASSGINALNPTGGDTTDLFISDTIKSGGDRSKPDLVDTLVVQSQDAIAFLESYGVDLSKVGQLGGHSVPRSRANPVGGNVGFTIMSKMTAAVKAAGVKVLEGHKLEQLLTDANGSVVGVRLTGPQDTGSQSVELPAQAVILAAGGYAANRSLLQKHCPEAAPLATTNGPWAQGDVLDIAAKAGAVLRDLDQVQIHPTGFVDPADPQSGTKFLAPEKLRGVGGILINKEGRRFVDELTTRDKASKAMASQSGGEAWLVLPSAAAEDYGQSAIGFYVAKSLMNKVEGAQGLADLIGVDVSVIQATLSEYQSAMDKEQADPFGKTVFPAAFSQSDVMYAARVTPVVHYTMGGVEINAQSQAVSSGGGVVPGLYAAGEVSGGVHGRNRLGGNSLLECVVYGRIAGSQAAAQLLAASAATATAAADTRTADQAVNMAVA